MIEAELVMSASSPSPNHYHQCIQRALKVLESECEVLPTLEELARAAGLSPFHFHRIFRSIVGEPVASYHKRLRMERAISHLLYSKKSITDIALGAGFESSSAFSKAFRGRYQCSPSTLRKQGGTEALTKPIQAPPSKPTRKMNVELKNIDPIKVYSVRKTGPYKEAAAEAFSQLMPFAYGNRVMKPETRIFGISHDNPSITEAENIRYEACITQDVVIPPTGEVEAQTIAGGLHAVALHKGSYETLPESYNSLIAHWLPDNHRELRDVPLFEEYLNRDPRRTKPENLRTLIFLPIK